MTHETAQAIGSFLGRLFGWGSETGTAFVYYVRFVFVDGDYRNDYLTYAGTETVRALWLLFGFVVSVLFGF